MPLSIRRPWTIPPQRERDDGPARRRLDTELEQWRKLGQGARQPGVRTEPDRPRELREIAEGFAPDIFEATGLQEAAFRRPEDVQAGLRDVGARRATEFGEAFQSLSSHEQAKVKAISGELSRLGITPADLVGFAAQNRPEVRAPGFQETELPLRDKLWLREASEGRLSDEKLRALISRLPEPERGQYVLGRIDEAVREDEEVQASAPEPGAQFPEGSFPREVLERGVEDPIEALFGAEFVRRQEQRGGQQDFFMRIVADVITWGGSEVALQLADGDIEGAIKMGALVGVPVTAIRGLTLAARSARETKAIQELAQEAIAGRAAGGAPLEPIAVREGLAGERAVPSAAPQPVTGARPMPQVSTEAADAIVDRVAQEGAERLRQEAAAIREAALARTPRGERAVVAQGERLTLADELERRADALAQPTGRGLPTVAEGPARPAVPERLLDVPEAAPRGVPERLTSGQGVPSGELATAEARVVRARNAVDEGGGFEAKLELDKAETAAKKARVEAGAPPVRERVTTATTPGAKSSFFEAEAKRLQKEESDAAFRAKQSVGSKEWRESSLGESYARMRDDIREDFVRSLEDEGWSQERIRAMFDIDDPTYRAEADVLFSTPGERFRPAAPSRLTPGQEAVPPVARAETAGAIPERAPPAAAEPARIVDDFEPIQPEALSQVETRPTRIAGAGDQFTSPLRPFDDVVRDVEVPDNPILQSIAAKTGINPSAAIERQRPVTRAITAYYRQLASGEQLTNVAVQGAFDVHAGPLGRLPMRFRADARTQLTDGEWVAWNDVLSNDRFGSRLTPEQIALRDDYRRVVDEVEFLRTQAGLRPRAARGPDATKPDGWFYIPRQVDEVRGLSIDRASDPGLQRFYQEAEEGIAKGVRYAEDPRQVLSLHVRNAYREIAAKQLSDHLETPLISASAKQLIPERTLQRMSDATTRRMAAERRVRTLQAERLRTQVGRTGEPTEALPRGTRAAEQQVRGARAGERGRIGREIKAAQAELTGAMEQYRTAKTQYSAALKAARKKRIGPGSLFGRHEDEIEIGQWRNRFFERGDAELLTEELGAFMRTPERSNMIGRAFKNVGDASRFLAAVGDFAVQFLQGLPLLGRNPAAWSKATLRSFQAWFDPAVQARYIRDNADVMQEMAAHNIPVGDVEFFTAIREGGAPPIVNIGEMIERLPGGKLARGAWRGLAKQTFGRFQASYDTFLTIARAELWKGMKLNWQGSTDDLAAHIRNMTGGLDSRALGVGPTQRGIESTWLAFSPRFLRSTVALMSDAAGAGGRDRAFAAWRALGPLMTGAVGMYVASGLALGKSEDEIKTGLNPLSGKRFLSHQINGDWVGIGGQIRGIMQGMAKSGAVIARGTQDPAELQAFLKLDQWENPLLNFALSRSAPATRIAQGIGEYATGNDVLPFEQIDSLPDLLLQTGTSALPFALQGWLEGEQALTTGLALVGARTSPATQRDTFNRLYEEKYGVEPQPDVSPRTLDPELAAQAGYGTTEFREERAGIVAGEEGRLADLAGIVLRGNPDAMEQFGDELGDFFRFRSGVTETLVRDLNLPEREASLVQDYYDLDPRDHRDPETGSPDWDRFRREKEAILRQLRTTGHPEAAAALERGTGIEFSNPDLQRAYEARQELQDGLDGYYETDSDDREEFRRRNPEIDAKLYLLGRVSRVVTRSAQTQVRTLSQRLLGTAVEASRGAGREFGDPIRLRPLEPISLR